jgi:hypothetical protein
VARDANGLHVTIIRPKADEIPEKTRIGGLAALANVIAKRIREETKEARSSRDDGTLVEEEGEP